MHASAARLSAGSPTISRGPFPLPLVGRGRGADRARQLARRHDGRPRRNHARRRRRRRRQDAARGDGGRARDAAGMDGRGGARLSRRDGSPVRGLRRRAHRHPARPDPGGAHGAHARRRRHAGEHLPRVRDGQPRRDRARERRGREGAPVLELHPVPRPARRAAADPVRAGEPPVGGQLFARAAALRRAADRERARRSALHVQRDGARHESDAAHDGAVAALARRGPSHAARAARRRRAVRHGAGGVPRRRRVRPSPRRPALLVDAGQPLLRRGGVEGARRIGSAPRAQRELARLGGGAARAAALHPRCRGRARESARRERAHHRQPGRGDRHAHVARRAGRGERPRRGGRALGARRAPRAERALRGDPDRRERDVRVHAPTRARRALRRSGDRARTAAARHRRRSARDAVRRVGRDARRRAGVPLLTRRGARAGGEGGAVPGRGGTRCARAIRQSRSGQLPELRARASRPRRRSGRRARSTRNRWWRTSRRRASASATTTQRMRSGRAPARRPSAAGDTARVAAIERRLGLGAFWSSRYETALAHFDVALEQRPASATTRCSRASASPRR